MPGKQPDLDEQRRKAAAANAELARHERRTCTILRLVVILDAILLTLAMVHLLVEQWLLKNLWGFIHKGLLLYSRCTRFANTKLFSRCPLE